MFRSPADPLGIDGTPRFIGTIVVNSQSVPVTNASTAIPFSIGTSPPILMIQAEGGDVRVLLRGPSGSDVTTTTGIVLVNLERVLFRPSEDNSILSALKVAAGAVTVTLRVWGIG